jgi:hypothetical protein
MEKKKNKNKKTEEQKGSSILLGAGMEGRLPGKQGISLHFLPSFFFSPRVQVNSILSLRVQVVLGCCC